MKDNFIIENKQLSPVRGAGARAEGNRLAFQEISLEFFWNYSSSIEFTCETISKDLFNFKKRKQWAKFRNWIC